MKVTVTGRKMEMTGPLKSHVEEKISGIKKFLKEVKDVHVVLSVEKHRHFAEITINANGYVINCKEETADMYTTIDRVIDKLGKQLRKHKDRIISLKNKKKTEGEMMNFRTEILSYDEDVTSNNSVPVIKSEKFDSKPMFLDEASSEIISSKKKFLVFRNASNSKINVLYIRNDGNLGLVDTE